MKRNNIYTALLSLSLLGLGACSLDLEPLTSPSSSSYPSSMEEANFGLNAVYSSLTAYSASTTTWWKVTDNITDIGATRVNTAMYTELITSGASAENAVANKLYNCVYKTVARINQLLDALDNLRGTASDTDIESIRAELLCIRAFCYDQACQHYGDLPYVVHTAGINDSQTPRTPRETIVENLLSDLSDECLANLPLRHKAESYGSARIGRVAAYALRARIALNWKKYDLAASSAKQALNLAKEAGFELESINTQYCGESHEAGEPTGQTALFGYDGEASNEWLWSVQYDAVISSNKTKEAYYMAPRTLGGCAYFGPTQTFVDMFQCKDGKSITGAGAISACSMVKPIGDSAKKWDAIVGNVTDLCGSAPQLIDELYKSESDTNFNNRSIAWLLKNYNRIYDDPDMSLDLYTRQCSLGVTALQLSVAAGTIANGGVNPVTKKEVFDASLAPKITAMIAAVGFYEHTGDWMYTSGIPAKTGVGGGVMGVLPGQFGIAAFAPPLDGSGNSVKAQLAIEYIMNKLRLNVFGNNRITIVD